MESRGEVIVNWELGLHIRPATNIAKLLQSYNSEVTLTKNDTSCNAKSVIQIITLGAEFKDKLSIHAQGEDAEEALATVVGFF